MQERKVFSVFRYQLLPTTTKIQTRIDEKYNTYEELVEKKNAFFKEVITNNKLKFRGKGYDVISRVENVIGEYIFLKMGVQKVVSLHDKDFKSKVEYNYPNSLVYINNLKDKQFMLIEHDTEAFSKTEALKNIIEKSVNNALKHFDLNVYIEKITDVSQFWDTIQEYEGRIKTLRFEFIKPNMSNISGKAVDAIRLLRNKANSHKTNLELNAPKNGVLENINPENKEISSLAQYSADGGGVPKIKVKKYRKLIKTSDREETIEVEEINIEGKPYEKIAELLNTLFDTQIE
ncbi:hypothetical protein [Allomuricauda sp. M10]|uniref:hypothetical protein n=1 Tax=Allomuricauda sp. M10 TaxID=2683292 RepID=UPI001D1910B4|nr:hypothetical protein [Muricauda sp. M10]